MAYRYNYMYSNKNFSILRRIADHEILTSLFSNDLSLMNGQMGVAIFFALLSRESDNRWYEDFAGELLERICERITIQLPVNFAYGLCGIGWGIEFLKHRGFLKCDTDEILSEIDKVVMERDVRRVTDTSLETGLQGIYAYVTARLHSDRASAHNQPFDDLYLNDLKLRLLSLGINPDETDYKIESVWHKYLGELSNRNMRTAWQNACLFIEQRAASLDAEKVNSTDIDNYFDYLYSSSKELVVIFSVACAGTQYGVGTYLRYLTKCFDLSHVDVAIVTLHNSVEHQFEISDGFAKFSIPNYTIPQSHTLGDYIYDQACFYFLASKICNNRRVICHFNIYGNIGLIHMLKENLQARIIYTVHFTNWGLGFNGDYERMKRLLIKPKNELSENESKILRSYFYERNILKNADVIIAPSLHTLVYLTELYGISKDNIRLIPHIVEEVKLEGKTKTGLRKKYGFQDMDKIVLYIGRLDRNKGIFDLINAIKPIMRKDSRVKLLIVGTGQMNEVLVAAYPYWSKIMCIGFQPKEVIWELMTLSDLGVVPSHYEEFGYVALEMAISKLSTLVSDVGGLHNIAMNFENVFTFTYDNPTSLRSKIEQFLEEDIILSTCYDNSNLSEFYQAESYILKMRKVYSYCSMIKRTKH